MAMHGLSGTVQPRFDRSVLEALIELIGPDSVRDFLNEFGDLARTQHDAIRAAFDAGDFEVLYREAHNLVSTAGNLGIRRTSALADMVQNEARAGDIASLESSVEDLLVELEAAIAALSGIIAQDARVA